MVSWTNPTVGGDTDAWGTELNTILDTIQSALNAITPGGVGIYGDGSDGALVFDGTNAVTGASRSGTTYTLSRDIFATDITVNSGVTINTNLYRIFATGTLTNNGSIKLNGNDAAANVGGVGISNTTSSINNNNSTKVGTAGGNGVTASAGAVGTNQSGNYTLGGRGGTGGTGTSGAGGAAGTLNAAPASAMPPRTAPQAMSGRLLGGASDTVIYGGTGGGSGGGDASHQGGGGGGGAGIVIIVAKAFAGTGVIQARGGGGAAGQLGNTGGGGGGGGGVILVVSGSVSSGAITGQTIDANGGTGGALSGTGTNGATGSNGLVILVPN